MTGTEEDLISDDTADLNSFNIEPQYVGGRLDAEEPSATASTIVTGTCSIGRYSYLNRNCEIANVSIGRYCSIGQYTLINPGVHRTDCLTTHPLATDPSGIASGFSHFYGYESVALTSLSRIQEPEFAQIGSDVWIGAMSIIMAVKIGHGAVIGAGSVVTNDVEPYSVVGGVPARHIRYRFEEPLRERLLASEWWNYDLSAVQERDYSEPERFLDLLDAAIERGAAKRIKPRRRVFGV